jgi:tetratricopeptide (TPR) repeat protein
MLLVAIELQSWSRCIRCKMASKDEISHAAVASTRGPEGTAVQHHGVFSKEGDFWRVGFENDSFTLRHSKGLSYLAQLLRFPGREFHAQDLIHGIAGDSDDTSVRLESSLPRGEDALAAAGLHTGDLGDAGEMLDDQAKAQYRRRLEELRDELKEAKSLGNVARAEQAESEIEALTAELSRAVGLGGRDRKAASASERARQSVTHAIKSALDRIEENHHELGAVLLRRISTGTFCAYYPDPAVPLVWEFGASSTQHRASDPDPAIAHPAVSGVRSLDSLRPPIAAASARNRTEIVGREAELTRLRNAAESALLGHGSFVLVGGGPGVGKTRLSLEFLAQASNRGFACLNGRCYERDEPHPLMPFVEVIEGALAQASSVEQFRSVAADDAAELAQIAPALRRVFPDLTTPAELPTQQQRRHLFQGLFDFIARSSRNQPLLLLVDDIHWADESTLAMLGFLARRVEHVPVLVVANYRDEGLDATRPLNRTLEELIRLGVDPIKLAGLHRESVREMLVSLSGRHPPDHLVTLIFEETQGNPFFVEEVFRHLVEEGKIYDEAGDFRESLGSDDVTVPENIRLVLGRRLDRLSEDAREVLSAASVIGRSFNFVLLEAVLDRMDPDALFDGLEEAEHTGFITSSSQGPEAPFAFSHELVRQTLLAGISLPRQQRLHLKIALAMEKVFAARIEEHAAEVAYHLVKSGPYIDAGKAMSYLSLTGQILLRAGALEDARLTLVKALQYQSPDPVMHARTLADLAGAERGLGDWNAATSHLQEAIGLYLESGDLRSVGRIVFEMVESLAWTGRFDAAAEIAERGLNHLRSKDEDAYRYRLLAALGYIQAASGAIEPARRAFDEVVASPAASPFLARVLAYRSVCSSNFLQLGPALEDSRRSVEMSNPQSSPWTHALALSIEMRALYQMGKPDQALKIAIELEPLARSVGQLAALTFCISIRAWAEFGRFPDLAMLGRRIRDDLALNRAASLSLFIAQSLAQVSLVEFLAGNWDTARSLAEEACNREVHRAFAGFGPSMLLRLAGYSGARDRAVQLADETRPRLPIPRTANTIGAWLLLIGTIEGLAMIGERGRTAELYPLVRELLEAGVKCTALEIRFPETVAGIAAGAAGDWERAEQHFLAARKQALELPHRLEEAEVRRFHSMMLIDRAASGDRERARRLLGEALVTYTRIGMPRHVKLTRNLLDQSA